jgi:hypothetical protein
MFLPEFRSKQGRQTADTSKNRQISSSNQSTILCSNVELCTQVEAIRDEVNKLPSQHHIHTDLQNKRYNIRISF